MSILNAQGNPYRDVEVLHPARELGRDAGAKSCDDEALYLQVIDAAFNALLDETTPEHVAEKVYENLAGYAEGRAAMLEVEPLLFLTRHQTAKVLRMPRRVRRAFMAEYQRGVRQWQRRGGALTPGNRPVIPVPPGEEVTE